MIRFVCFASGSSGNCYYLATDKTSILIDAGIGARTIKRRFKEFGLDLESLKAVLVTHDHVDHVKAVGVLGEKYHIPIYSTSRVHDGIKRCYNVTEKLKVSARFIQKEVSFTIGDFSITPFEVPHDSLDNIGPYSRWSTNKRRSRYAWWHIWKCKLSSQCKRSGRNQQRLGEGEIKKRLPVYRTRFKSRGT